MPRFLQAEVAEDIRTIFTAPDRIKADEYLKEAIRKYEKTATKLASWMEQNISEGLAVFSFPAHHLCFNQEKSPILILEKRPLGPKREHISH